MKQKEHQIKAMHKDFVLTFHMSHRAYECMGKKQMMKIDIKCNNDKFYILYFTSARSISSSINLFSSTLDGGELILRLNEISYLHLGYTTRTHAIIICINIYFYIFAFLIRIFA